MRKPAVSVIMPARIADARQEQWLWEAVASIRFQTFQDFEFIIVNDGSPHQVDWKYYGSHARVIQLPECKGIANALNVALECCSSNLVVHMDADDIAYDNMIQRHVDFFKTHPHGMAHGIQLRAFYFDTYRETSIGGGFPTKHPPLVDLDKALELGRKNCFWWVNHPGLCFRRDLVMNIGGYREADLHGKKVPGMEDMILWLSMVRAHLVIHNCPDVLMDYRWKPSPSRQTDEFRAAHKRETELFMNPDL